ncbi:PHP domain-containing protein [Pleionea sediminis]|uniref:PHP domain-containing protein n=1 Tax=Pleionea sediminis TaxID=2569479 RepID=UPI0011847A76|nr:PHP domain-containing protein [Pleionea sediminis]
MNPAAHSHAIDLHCHTHYSDGSLCVDQLLSHVVENGVKTLAITDHDSIGAHLEIAERALQTPCEIIPGVEISCQFGNREIHVVGLQIDINNQDLNRFLSNQQRYRRQRLSAFAEKLEALGIDGVSEAVAGLSPESVTRTHLSQILVSLGAAPDSNRVFKRLIGRKGKAYVAAEWPDLQEVVEVISKAGGHAIIAHPGRYQLARRQLKELISQFVAAGGQGIELAYPNADPALIRWLSEQAIAAGLHGSQGADFHNPEWRWVKPGHFAPMPSNVQPIWELW